MEKKSTLTFLLLSDCRVWLSDHRVWLFDHRVWLSGCLITSQSLAQRLSDQSLAVLSDRRVWLCCLITESGCLIIESGCAVWSQSVAVWPQSLAVWSQSLSWRSEITTVWHKLMHWLVFFFLLPELGFFCLFSFDWIEKSCFLRAKMIQFVCQTWYWKHTLNWCSNCCVFLSVLRRLERGMCTSNYQIKWSYS